MVVSTHLSRAESQLIANKTEAYLEIAPQSPSPFLCALPHSSREYAESFLARSVLDAVQIRSSEDAYLDLLLESAPVLGATLMQARTPRAYLDLNRAPDELDPALIEGLGKVRMTPRTLTGLGVVPRVVSGGKQIYRGKLTLAEAQDRIAGFHEPYHARLEALLRNARARHGKAYLLDWHSMPHDAVSASGREHPQIVIGDLHGCSASKAFSKAMIDAFEDQGFRVSYNHPFAGAYVLERHGKPELGQHAVQIEIDRSLYMDEKTLTLHDGFETLAARVTDVLKTLFYKFV